MTPMVPMMAMMMMMITPIIILSWHRRVVVDRHITTEGLGVPGPALVKSDAHNDEHQDESKK